MSSMWRRRTNQILANKRIWVPTLTFDLPPLPSQVPDRRLLPPALPDPPLLPLTIPHPSASPFGNATSLSSLSSNNATAGPLQRPPTPPDPPHPRRNLHNFAGDSSKICQKTQELKQVGRRIGELWRKIDGGARMRESGERRCKWGRSRWRTVFKRRKLWGGEEWESVGESGTNNWSQKILPGFVTEINHNRSQNFDRLWPIGHKIWHNFFLTDCRSKFSKISVKNLCASATCQMRSKFSKFGQNIGQNLWPIFFGQNFRSKYN